MKIAKLVEEWRELGPARWAEHAYGWIMPDGKPITLEPWQRAALEAWWGQRHDVTTFALSNIKKTGKTTVDAILMAWRWLALPGEGFACANDLDQAAGRQFSMVAAMVKRHPLLKQHVKATAKRLVFEPTSSTLEAIEVDATGRAGSNHSTASFTETWGVIYEAGIRAWEELTPPPGRFHGFPALRIADSYAGWEGEATIWHDLVDRGLAGERVSDEWPIYRNGGLLLFHIAGEEAQRRCFRGTAEERAAYYEEQGESLRAGTYARLHLNQRGSGESRFVDVEVWDALIDRACHPVQNRFDERPLWLGADAGTKRDACALVGCTWNGERQRAELAYVREWHPHLLARLAGGIDLDGTLGVEIERLHRENDVMEVRCDPWQMASIMNRLEKAGVNVVEMPQTAQRSRADQALYDGITSGRLATFPSPALQEAMRKAAAKEGIRGWRLAKRPGDDLAVALSMAHWGALQGGAVNRRAIVYPDIPYHRQPRTIDDVFAEMQRQERAIPKGSARSALTG